MDEQKLDEQKDANPKDAVAEKEPPKKEYEPPAIIYRAPLEAMAGVCDIKNLTS